MAVTIRSAVLILSTIYSMYSVSADVFLGPQTSAAHEHEAADLAIREALEAALGSDHQQAAHARLDRLKDALRPTFASLPKNARGAVDAAAARYALHRLFVQRHGWQMSGLHPQGEAWAAASPTEALGERVPGHVRSVFEGRLGARGLDLEELALLAATLEQLVHREALQRLEATYRAFGLEGSKLTSTEAQEVIDAYMASYILGSNASTLTEQQVREQAQGIEQLYPTWPETVAFLREVQREVARDAESLGFFQVAAVVEEVGERYGRWQQSECHALKEQLVRMESGNGTGRVRLSDFYGGALNGGQWQFSESTEYLRQLGALDESDPAQLSVIIPNYINGPSNCVASGGYYSVCCIDECEALMGRLEAEIAAPSAAPAEILERVALLPSSSVPAGRALPAGLAAKLEDVARHHGGRVPLHGRLFQQWLHLAYPRECPFPHVSGTTNPQRPEAWEAQTGQQVAASEEEMAQHIEAGKAKRPLEGPGACADGVCSAMWTMEEELVASHTPQLSAPASPHGSHGTGRAKDAARSAALFAAVFAMALGLVGTVRQAMSSIEGSETPIKFVV